MDDRISTYPGFWKRAGAFALDYMIILGYLAVITIVGLLINSRSGASQWLFADRVRAQAAGFLLITLPTTLYFALSESSVRQATWGKKRVGLQVTGYNGSRISVGRSLVRTALKFVPWELSHTLIWNLYFAPNANSISIQYGFILVYGLLGLYLVSLIFTKTHQTIYDFLAGTYVTGSRS